MPYTVHTYHCVVGTRSWHWPLAPGYWPLATGPWLLATGYWVVTTNVGTALKAAATQYMIQYMKGHCLIARFSGLPTNDPDHGRVVVTAVDPRGQGIKQDPRVRPGLLVTAVQGRSTAGVPAKQVIKELENEIIARIGPEGVAAAVAEGLPEKARLSLPLPPADLCPPHAPAARGPAGPRGRGWGDDAERE